MRNRSENTMIMPDDLPFSRSRESSPKRKGRRLDPADAAAMGSKTSPAKVRAAQKNALLSPGHTAPHTEETKAKISKASMGNASKTGMRLSEETKEKIRQGNLAAAARRREAKEQTK